MEVALVILDGWGINRYWPVASDAPDRDADSGRDAIAAASTPTYDALLERGTVCHLRADGPSVGLPDGRMGNSAVGHLTIGAGTAIDQPLTRIDRAVRSDALETVPAIADWLAHAGDHDSRLHVWGLLSDGGVHAEAAHIEALVDIATSAGVETAVHVVTDGRDTPPRCAARILGSLARRLDGRPHASVATVTGRYLAMDRDTNWERTRRAYEAMVNGTATRVVAHPTAAIDRAYAVGESDEFIAPTRVRATPTVEDGDAVFMANFRADRARQLTRLLGDIQPTWPFDLDPPDVHLATMTTYDETFDLPVAFEPIVPDTTLGAEIAAAGLTQLRIAESEKYPHVTYFINGGRERQYPGERREIVPSPDVATYDRQPEMSATAVTDRAVAIIDAEDPDVLVLNYANPDMVGHTGDFSAAVAAVEAVDDELSRLLDALADAHVFVIADHGNVDDMGTPDDPHTAHTTNPVPLIYLRPGDDRPPVRIRQGGTLADVAPTLLVRLGLSVPEAMTGRDLLDDE